MRGARLGTRRNDEAGARTLAPRVGAPLPGRLDCAAMDAIRVGALLDDKKFDLRLALVSGKRGLSRRISSARIQKPGLVLAGFTEYLHKERIQIFGNTEMSYLRTLPQARAVEVLDHFLAQDVSCLVVTKDLEPTPETIAASERHGVPVLRTSHLSSQFIEAVQSYLEDVLSPSTSMHGVLLDVFGVGILLLGKSGIGKSEIALDLIMRGHRLVADDIVDVFRKPADALPIAEEAVAIGARTLWLQIGVINEEARRVAEAAGLTVVMDRCVKIEYARLFGGLNWFGVNTKIISARRPV